MNDIPDCRNCDQQPEVGQSISFPISRDFGPSQFDPSTEMWEGTVMDAAGGHLMVRRGQTAYNITDGWRHVACPPQVREIGRQAIIAHRCTGSTARATWNGAEWQCQCGDIVFPARVVEMGRPGHTTVGAVNNDEWLGRKT
jgi:hypothetical protein